MTRCWTDYGPDVEIPMRSTNNKLMLYLERPYQLGASGSAVTDIRVEQAARGALLLRILVPRS